MDHAMYVLVYLQAGFQRMTVIAHDSSVADRAVNDGPTKCPCARRGYRSNNVWMNQNALRECIYPPNKL